MQSLEDRGVPRVDLSERQWLPTLPATAWGTRRRSVVVANSVVRRREKASPSQSASGSPERLATPRTTARRPEMESVVGRALGSSWCGRRSWWRVKAMVSAAPRSVAASAAASQGVRLRAGSAAGSGPVRGRPAGSPAGGSSRRSVALEGRLRRPLAAPRRSGWPPPPRPPSRARRSRRSSPWRSSRPVGWRAGRADPSSSGADARASRPGPPVPGPERRTSPRRRSSWATSSGGFLGLLEQRGSGRGSASAVL